MSQPDATVEVERRDAIAYVSLNRPQVLNAVTTPLLLELITVFEQLSDDAQIRCVVLKGNGRAFCVGADQKERPGMSDEDIRRRRRIAPLAFASMRNCVHPVISRVHGFAFGSGVEIAVGCDIVVMAESAKLGLIETQKGMIPAGGGTQLLPRLLGPLRAKELILTGRRFGAAEARDWGIANYVVPDDELDTTVNRLAAEICAAAPVAVRQAKRAVDAALDLDLRRGIEMEAALYERVLHTEDRFEAQRAYAENRQPQFEGK
jgi:enoyl-CoA hydratase/carnithine racemase